MITFPGVRQSLIALNIALSVIFYVVEPIMITNYENKMILHGILTQFTANCLTFSFMCLITLLINLMAKLD